MKKGRGGGSEGARVLSPEFLFSQFFTESAFFMSFNRVGHVPVMRSHLRPIATLVALDCHVFLFWFLLRHARAPCG